MFRTKKPQSEALETSNELQLKIDQLEARLERMERTLQARRSIDLAAFEAERRAGELVAASATAQFAQAWENAQRPAPESSDFFDLESEDMPARQWLLASS